MGQVVLVSDVQTPLGEELARRYLAEGAGVAATRSNQESRESPLVSESDGFLLTDWNRSSSISARNVLLSVLNRFGRIDEAVLLGNPAVERRQLHEQPFASIERAVDAWVKGTLFLARSVLEAFGREGGRLALVHYATEEPGTGLPPLEAALRGAFRALTQSLLDTHSQKGVSVRGFESFSTPPREFAAFIVESMIERGDRPSGGKWLRFQPKSGLLAPLRALKS